MMRTRCADSEMVRTFAICHLATANFGVVVSCQTGLDGSCTATTFEEKGEALFELACKRDLEGIVAKRKGDPYVAEHATWLKIRNRNYSQWIGREELFERERASDPDWQHWNTCASACDQLIEAV